MLPLNADDGDVYTHRVRYTTHGKRAAVRQGLRMNMHRCSRCHRGAGRAKRLMLNI